MHVCMNSGWGGVGGGGANNVVHELSKFLTKNDIKVTIFINGFRDITQVSENCTIEEILPYNLLPNKLHFAFYDRYTYSLKVWRRIKSSKSFDIIHGHADNCFFARACILNNR